MYELEKKKILTWVDIDFEVGKNYCLLWKNGSGKSTLSSFLMWQPKYEHFSGSVHIDSTDLLELSPDERSKAWLFLSFQHVPEISGIRFRWVFADYLQSFSRVRWL